MLHHVPRVLLLTLFLLPGSAAVGGQTFYVSREHGNDGFSGRSAVPRGDADGPLATVAAAIKAARAAGADTARTIEIEAGNYFLEETLRLDASDSRLTIKPLENGRVTLYGGRRITGWKREGEKLWYAEVPEVASGAWDFRLLTVNDRWAARSRLPSQGRFTHLSEFDVAWVNDGRTRGWQRPPTEEELTTMRYRKGDLGPWLDVNNAEVTVFFMWNESLVGLEAMDDDTQTLRFSRPARMPPGAWRTHEYVVWNTRRGLQQPGQWQLDRSRGRVYYWPRENEDMRTATVVAPVLDSIIEIKGTAERAAEDITIEGLRLSVTNAPMVHTGRCAGDLAGAITIDHARGCRLINLTIDNTGGQGIKAFCHQMVISGCHVHHVGACGVKFGGFGSEISDNDIHHIGLIYPSGIGIFKGFFFPPDTDWDVFTDADLSDRGLQTMDDPGVRIAHNRVHDTSYSAIVCDGHNNVIEANRIYRAMRDLADGSGIYMAMCRNNVIRGNFVHDIAESGGFGVCAYYLDEKSRNCLVEGNLSVNVGRPSHNHIGHDNTIRNNVFLMESDGRITLQKCSDYTFERNVVVAAGSMDIHGAEQIARYRDNVIFSGTGKVSGGGDDNVFADPGLVRHQDGKVVFNDRSLIERLGIRPVDVSNAGPRQNADRPSLMNGATE